MELLNLYRYKRILAFVLGFSLAVLSSTSLAQFGFLGLGGSDVQASGEDAVSLKVIDTYADMHTGPGRGYPIFYVVEEGEWIEVLTRRPDWYEVRTLRGKVGWVTAAQIARTLQDSGEPADLPTVSYGDYLKNRWRSSIVAGSFVSGRLEGAETFNASIGYRPLDWLGLEVEAGRFFNTDIAGTIASFNVVLEPLSHWRISPALVLGGGFTRIKNQPKGVEADSADEELDHFQFGIRVNYYLGRNFVIRGEYKTLALTADDIEQEDSGTWNFGFSTFF